MLSDVVFALMAWSLVACDNASNVHQTVNQQRKNVEIACLTPQQARIDSLKRQKDIASKNLKAERDRQKIAKAQQTIQSVVASK